MEEGNFCSAQQWTTAVFSFNLISSERTNYPTVLSLCLEMFVDLTRPERDAFLSQTSGCLIPGYTGHCPTLKFRIGKRYGANTQEIMKELSDRGVLKRHLAREYRQPDPLQAMLTDGKFSVIEHSKGQTRDLKVDSSNRCRRYILGYTGYIPGMHFRYGTSFRRAADQSVAEFSRRMSEEASRRALEGAGVRARSRSAPRLVSIRARDQVQGALDQYCQHDKFQEAHITPELPPIAGYTGHIPRVKGTEASLSQRFHTAAKRGLTLLRQEQEKRRGLSQVNSAVQGSLPRPFSCTTPGCPYMSH